MNIQAQNNLQSNYQPRPPAHVVLLEDQRERGGALRELLREEGLEVEVVGRDRDALHWLQQGLAPEPEAPPQLLVCNARMLGEGGLEVLARWCRVNPGVDVILLSAFASPKLRLRMVRLPVRLVLDQVFTLEVVRSAARELAHYWDSANWAPA